MSTTYTAHTFVGSNAQYWIPDDILVEVSIVPASLIGHVRSGQPNLADVEYTTQHDTGNPGATADNERNYLHGGPRNKDGSKRLVGYNFAADGLKRTVGGTTYIGKIIQITPLNEVTWAAGTATGNRTSWHTEMCFGGQIDWDATKEVNAALQGAILAAQGWANARLRQHNAWSGKDCPGQLRRKGEWPEFVKMVESARVAALEAASGTPESAPPPPPDPPAPDPEPDALVPSRLFGEVGPWVFDPNGPVSKAWLARGRETGRWPRLVDVLVEPGRKAFVFGDGSVAIAEPGKPIAWATDLAA